MLMSSSHSNRLFLRHPARNKSTLLKSQSHKLKRRKPKEKPTWDSSAKDLTVYKPSLQELQRNHDIHKPKKDHERLHFNRQCYHGYVDFSTDSFSLQDTPAAAGEKKRALIKEIFYNQEKELRSVLKQADETVASVEDLFGDDVQKYRGNPVVTKAPNYNGYTNSFLHGVDGDEPTPYDKLSASVMRTSALNSVSSESSLYTSDEDDCKGNNRNNMEESTRSEYQSKIDLSYYENIVDGEPDVSESNNIPSINKSNDDAQFVNGDINTYSHFVNEIQAVINNENRKTNHIEKNIQHLERKSHKDKDTKKRRKKDDRINLANQDVSNSARSDQSSYSWKFDEMKKKLDELDIEIESYENECGENGEQQKETASSVLSNSVSGYTMRLLSSITRMVNHLKKSEIQLRSEMAMRKDILDAFEEQRLLIDSLTNDLIETQEQNSLLKEQLELQTKTSNLQYQYLNDEITMLKKTMIDFISTQTNYSKLDQSYEKQRVPLSDLNKRDNKTT